MNTLYLYEFNILDPQKERTIPVFAPNLDAACNIFHMNFGFPDAVSFRRVREATRKEMREINNTGAPHPRHAER